MPKLTARQILDRSMSEDDVDDAIRDTLRKSPYAWSAYHTYDSRRSAEGWPDWALCCPPWLALWELKKELGHPSPDQRRWLAKFVALRKHDLYLSVAIIRPSNLDQAEDFLLTLTNPPQLSPADLKPPLEFAPSRERKHREALAR